MNHLNKIPVIMLAASVLLGLPAFFLLLGIAGIVSMCYLFLKKRHDRKVQQFISQQTPPEIADTTPKTEQDIVLEAYGLIQKRISCYLLALFPEARWVWGTPNSLKRITEGQEIIIHLKNAGGHQSARVIYSNLQFKNLEFISSHSESIAPIKPEKKADTPVDYSLVAFEWINSRLEFLNAKANEAIAKSQDTFFIESEDLPDLESWPEICAKLKDDFSGACPESNKIKVTI